MKYNSTDAEKRAAFAVADLMAAAARTAPKACGVDNIEVAILDGEEKDRLAEEMRRIAEKTEAAFFERDAGNLDNSHCVVLIGVRNNPLGLGDCGFCGFKNCGEMKKSGTNCTFNVTDLGIAVGSAVSIAADNRIDNRVMYTAGKAAVSLKLLGDPVQVCYGIALATSAKNIFFDRAPGCVLV
ncbi:ferredoxin domain-containing protein [Clostridium aminobutyricum]|uniref:Ferredoxin n=1 Tax=Clostridium aminobutyricum TaxID=33953 RepID=A0A939IIS3_CLOAM|nr:DUF2148 domain-containing protein [Clostridium aminobutyricum]MBN7773366.1 ferredoxin [Clostridium aminobutyricum]